VPVSTDGLRVDRVVGEGDRIEIGGSYFVVLETKGHTDCSLTYVLEPQGVMFASESTGVIRGPGKMHTAILKSYSDTMESAAKCRAYGARVLVAPHYGVLPPDKTEYYFDLYVKAAEEEKAFILGCRDRGMKEKEIFRAFDKKYWSEERSRAQPRAAFLENARYSVRHILENY
jgi:glyoxylase-like metal-dependent hydrolase (beta-lactamase superfamily II)